MQWINNTISTLQSPWVSSTTWTTNNILDYTMISWWETVIDSKLVLQTSRPLDTDIDRVKKDTQRNTDFLHNLLQGVYQLYPEIGKGDTYVKRSPSLTATNDRIEMRSSQWTTFFPAIYNADNAFVVKNGQPWFVFQATGLQLLDNQAGEYYIYYPAVRSDGSVKGTVVWIKQWNGVVIDNLMPLLYYKQQYFFTTKSIYGNQWVRVAHNNELLKLGDWALGNIAIDGDYFAFHDRWLNTLYILYLPTLKIVYSIDMSRSDISFKWLVSGTWDMFWVVYMDNQTQQDIYEQWIPSIASQNSSIQ